MRQDAVKRISMIQWTGILWLGLALASGSGCCTLNRLADAVTHAHENRCTCQLPAPVISSPLVAPVQGYLDQGPTVSGEIVAGEPGKSALDVVVELQDEVLALKEEQHRLRSQLDAARATIRQQEQTLEEATQELQQSAHDLSQMRNRLGDWQQQLAEISTHYLDAQTQQDSVVAELERRLRQILADCEADSRTRSVMQLAPDQPTAPPASPEDGPQL